MASNGFEYQLPGGTGGTGDPVPNSIFYKSLDHALKEQGITPRQVQIVWLSMPVSGKSWKTNLPPEARSFPADAEQSKLAWKEIVRAIYIRYPNVRIIYSSTKGTMYMSASATENPEFVGGPIEPFNHDAAWGVKWVIADQIKGAADLNYDPAGDRSKRPGCHGGRTSGAIQTARPGITTDSFGPWPMWPRTSCTHRSAASASMPPCSFTR